MFRFKLSIIMNRYSISETATGGEHFLDSFDIKRFPWLSNEGRSMMRRML